MITVIFGGSLMLNVALLNDSFPPAIDGVANAVLNYAQVITKKYGTATVITPRYPHVVDDYPFKVFRYSSAMLTTNMPYRVGNPFSPKSVMELKAKNFDIIHNHCPFASGVLAQEIALGKPRKMPIVFTYHTKFNYEIDKYVPNKQFNKIAKSFILKNINAADEVWAVSQGTVANLRELGYQGEVHVMTNGTDFKVGKAPIEQIKEIDRVYNLTDEFVLLFVGRIMWYKNLEIILDSLKNLTDAGYNFKAFFVGEGPDRFAVEHYAKTLGIYDRTIFTGAIYDREKVKAFFSRADLLLFPSTYDTSGLVVKEAATCGCPTVLTEGSCAAEGVEHGISGMLAKENAEDFTKRVAEVMNNQELHKKLSEECQVRLYAPWEKCVDKAVERYQVVIENFNKKKKDILF